MGLTASRSDALHRIAEWYSRNGFGTRVNDDGHAATELDCEGRRMRPPLVVMEGQRYVRFIVVETAESLDDGAPERWRASLGGGIPLHVYVPRGAYEQAWALRTEANLMEVRLVAYDDDDARASDGGAARQRG